MRRALVVVGKAPEVGRTKTRLVPPLSEVQAVDLARAFLQDTCATALGLGWEQVSLVHPPAEGAAAVFLTTLGVSLWPQRGTGLGDALAGAFADHRGFDHVVLIGSDTPDLPTQRLEDAGRQLSQPMTDLVIGPAADGGYYLLGTRRPQPGLFERIAWSTERVYAQTLARAARLGLRVAVLPTWADVDTPDDLIRLERRLRQAPPNIAPRTRVVLNRLASTIMAETGR